jgi:hypothetical protein
MDIQNVDNKTPDCMVQYLINSEHGNGKFTLPKIPVVHQSFLGAFTTPQGVY